MQQAAAGGDDHRQDMLASLERVSRELDRSYRDLEARVATLNEELAAARSARVAELAEKERLLERLASLMAVLPGGVLLVDAADRVRDANPAALELLGEPLLGQSWSVIEARIGAQTEQPRGRRLSVVARALEARDERVVLITDTTELHALQQRVGREERLTALGEMAARLAHQIRTPLASTTLYLSLLRRPELPAARRVAICDRLAERLGHTEQLIESTLTFLRDDSPVRAPVNVQDLLARVQELAAERVAAGGASLEVTPVDRSLQLVASAEELAGALVNLVENAVDNGGPGVAIGLWAGASDSRTLQLRVHDSGPGIPAADRERIFDPFYTTRAGGTGLGLAVVARTVSDHGGSVRAGAAAAGGAEFVIELPLAAASSP